jgi:hypothetical protein
MKHYLPFTSRRCKDTISFLHVQDFYRWVKTWVKSEDVGENVGEKFNEKATRRWPYFLYRSFSSKISRNRAATATIRS